MTELAGIEQVALEDTSSGDFDTLTHYVCRCSPDDALCSWVVKDAEWADDDDDMCVVCLELDQLPCPRCGQ